MKTVRLLHRLAAPAVLVLASLTGCDGQTVAPPPASHTDADALHAMQANVVTDAEVNSWLAGLRNATATFQQIEVAAAAGWSEPITACMELPGTGGMGYHYGNTALIDGVAQEFAPELLVYEPQKNGRLRLVAVEFIVPFAAWTDATPPSLHGIEFHANNAFGLWVLHAWIWRHNRAGIFADWNPDVSCAFAQ